MVEFHSFIKIMIDEFIVLHASLSDVDLFVYSTHGLESGYKELIALHAQDSIILFEELYKNYDIFVPWCCQHMPQFWPQLILLASPNLPWPNNKPYLPCSSCILDQLIPRPKIPFSAILSIMPSNIVVCHDARKYFKLFSHLYHSNQQSMSPKNTHLPKEKHLVMSPSISLICPFIKTMRDQTIL